MYALSFAVGSANPPRETVSDLDLLGSSSRRLFAALHASSVFAAVALFGELRGNFRIGHAGVPAVDVLRAGVLVDVVVNLLSDMVRHRSRPFPRSRLNAIRM